MCKIVFNLIKGIFVNTGKNFYQIHAVKYICKYRIINLRDKC